jgi:hypothetical protein
MSAGTTNAPLRLFDVRKSRARSVSRSEMQMEHATAARKGASSAGIVAAPAIPRMTSSVRTMATYGKPISAVTASTASSFAARISATVTGSEMSSSSERRSRSATIAYVVVREGRSSPPMTSSIG